MWRMLLKYLAEEEAALQWKELETQGTAHGTQASWQELIDAYTAYIPLAQAGSETACTPVWIKQIRGAQRLLPAHVVNEYCHSGHSSYPLPDFSNESVALPRSRLSSHGASGGEIDWYDSRCGVEWAYTRSNWERGAGHGHVTMGYAGIGWDRDAAAALLKIRQRQRAELGKRLEPVLRSLAISDALDSYFPSPLIAIVQAYDESAEVLGMSI